MREIHMYMKYKCEKCGHEVIMYLEKGLEEECNRNLVEKSGMPHKPVPFAIGCPKCNTGFMTDRGFCGLPNFFPAKPGMNLFINTPDCEHGVPIFDYQNN